jgi:tetratricopeptide (TPR) repeat protein
MIASVIAVIVAGLALLASPELRDHAWRAAYSAASLFGVKAPDDEFADLYKRLGIAPLPAGLAASGKISSGLAKLAREPCDKAAIFALGEALAAKGEARVAAEAYLGFAAGCPNGEGEEHRAGQLLLNLDDNDRVISIADALILKNPSVANYRYLRGKALAGAKRYQEALADYASTIELQNNRHDVNERVFTEMANIYAQIGKPCDAALTILAWVVLDPKTRNTPKARKLVQEFIAQGCQQGAAASELKKL